MKKLLLTIAAVSLATLSGMAIGKSGKVLVNNDKYQNCGPVAPAATTSNLGTRADESLDFGYAGDPYTAYKWPDVKKGYSVYQCVEMDTIALRVLKGSSITGLTIVNGTDANHNNPDRSIMAFISTDLSKEPVYTQKVLTGSKGFYTNKITLNTPFAIDGNTPVYFGYYFIASANTAFPIAVDGEPYNGNSTIVGTDADGGYPSSFSSASYEIGSLNISATISGANLPQNFALPKGVELELFYEPKNAPEYDLMIRNNGAASIKNFEVTIEADGEPVAIVPVTLAGAETGVFDEDFDGPKFTAEGGKNLKFYITKVNGEDNPYSAVGVGGFTVVSSTTYDRKLVMEEGTGCWCGYCPAGIVMMEYLKEKYNDTVYRIAVHGGQGTDLMKLPAAFKNNYNGWLNAYISGFPGATLNREIDVAPTAEGILDALDDVIEDILEKKTYAKAYLETMEFDSVSNVARFYCYADFPVNNLGTHYMSVAVVQDGMGPYNQQNYFAGGGLGAMDGWEKKGSSVSTIYDDVARGLSSFPGQAVTTGKIVAGTTYFDVCEIDMKYVSSDDFRAVLMLTNQDGVIVAADQLSLKKSGMRSALADKAAPVVKTGKGSISVSGAENVAIYSLTGANVANGSVEGLPAGIYVVKADSTVVKVIVR